MYSCGPPHMAVQKQDDQHEHTFSSYVRIRDVVLKTCLGRWTIGRSGERGSGISVRPARHDDDDDDLCETKLFEIELFICIKMDLALNNLQWLICHKTQHNQPYFCRLYKGLLLLLIHTLFVSRDPGNLKRDFIRRVFHNTYSISRIKNHVKLNCRKPSTQQWKYNKTVYINYITKDILGQINHLDTYIVGRQNSQE